MIDFRVGDVVLVKDIYDEEMFYLGVVAEAEGPGMYIETDWGDEVYRYPGEIIADLGPLD